jgi:hypothetical protein
MKLMALGRKRCFNRRLLGEHSEHLCGVSVGEDSKPPTAGDFCQTELHGTAPFKRLFAVWLKYHAPMLHQEPLNSRVPDAGKQR